MNKTLIQYLRVYFRLSDWISLNFAFFIAIFLRFGVESFWVFTTYNYLVFLLFYNVAWLLSAGWVGIYSVKSFQLNYYRSFIRILAFLLFNLIIVTAFNGVIKTYYSRLFIVYTYSAALVLLPLNRAIVKWLIFKYRKRNELVNNVLLITDTERVTEFDKLLKEQDHENLVNVRHTVLNEKIDFNFLKQIIENELNISKISELYLSLPYFSQQEMPDLLRFCEQNLIRLRLIPHFSANTGRSVEIVHLGETQVFGFPLSPLDEPANKMIKRIFDVTFSFSFILFVGSWLFPLIALFIKLGSKGPVFFVQKRSGLNNQEFNCLKFRSMRVNSESDVKQATQNDPRITAFGKFLRRSSLDEIPQFINVLKGEMSVVGPRPHMLKHTAQYSAQVGNFMQRHAIKPGITGLAQVKGYRGEIQNQHMLNNRIKLDTFYVENWSLAFDIRIVLLTITGAFKKHL